MPTYVVTSPDGVEYEVTAPEGATEQQAMEKVKAQYSKPTTDETWLDKTRQEGKEKDSRAVDYLKQIGSGVAKAGMDLVDAPFALGNVVSKGVANIFGGETYPKAMLPSEMPAIKDFVSKGTAPAIPKGQDKLADALRTSSVWGAGLLTNPAKKLPDILMGTGAAIGERLGGETGEVVGGLTGMLGGMKRAGKVPTISDSTSDEKAIKFIMENAEDPNQALVNLRQAEANNEVGSLAEKTRDRGIFNVESAAQKGSPLQHKLDDITQLRGEQIIGDVGQQFGTGGDASLLAGQRKSQLSSPIQEQRQAAIAEGNMNAEALADFERQLPKAQAQLAEAETQAQQAASAVDTNLKPSQAGEKLSGGFNTVEGQFIREKEKPAWKRFSKGEDLAVDDVKDIVDTGRAKLSETDNAILDQKFGSQMKLIDVWDETVAPDEIHTIVSQIKKINNNASENNDYDKANLLLSKVGDSLETALKNLGSKSDYDRAVAISKEKFDRFHPSRVGKERGKKEGQTLGTRMMDTKTGGAVIADLIKQADSPFITKQMEGVIKSVAKDGGVNEAFLKNYDEMLDRFPELKGQLQQVKKTQDDLVAAEKNVADVTKAEEAQVAKLPQAIESAKAKVKTDADNAAKGLKKSVGNLQINKFRNDSVKFIDDALKGTDKDLTKLNRQMGRVEGGQQALKAAVKDNVINKITVDNAGKATVPFSAIDDFSKARDNLVKSGILSADEAAQIDRALERASISGLRKKAAVQKSDEADSALNDILSSTAAITALGMLPASNQLMLAGTVKRLVKNKLQKRTVDKKTIEALNDMIVNPKRFLQGVADRKIVTEQQMDKYLTTYINGFSQSVAEDE